MKHPITFLTALLLTPLAGLFAAETVTRNPASTPGASGANIPYPDALAASAVTVTKLSDISRSGLVVGNGELNAILYSAGNDLHLRLAKNDCWDLRVDTENDPPLASIDPATGKVAHSHGGVGSWNKPYPTALPCAARAGSRR